MVVFVLPQSEPAPRCDFCGLEPPKWRWKTRSFGIPEMGWSSEGDFAACQYCNDLILADRWFALLERCLVIYHDTYGSPRYFIIKLQVGRMHQRFRENILESVPTLITSASPEVD